MLKGLVSVIIFFLIFIAIIAAVVIRFMYKGVRNIREAQEQFIKTGGKKMNRQEYIRYQQRERERHPFDDDYFKSSNNKKTEKTKKQEEKQTTTRRTTTTSDGVTIIDDRDTEGKRKIFDHSDGEYVEFEEVHS